MYEGASFSYFLRGRGDARLVSEISTTKFWGIVSPREKNENELFLEHFKATTEI